MADGRLSISSVATVAVEAGRKLRRIRERLGLTGRDVQEASQKIAEMENNIEFAISHVRLTQIENDGSMPSVFKLYTLATIYQLGIEDILRLYGIDLGKIDHYRQLNRYTKTHVLSTELTDREKTIRFPVRFDPGFRPEKTVFLSRLVQAWKEIPVALLAGLDLKHHVYGYIGSDDRTMYPLIRPGSIVQIDGNRRKVRNGAWSNEFERPIYFVEMRYEYKCCWCHQEGRKLTLIPYSLSSTAPNTIRVPDEGEVLGQVAGVAARIID